VTTSRPGGGQMAGTGSSTVFSVYPNPTVGALTIDAPTTGIFNVYTIDGKQVSSYVINEAKTSIVLPNNLASGIYMCRFNGDDGNITMVRLVYEQ
jgi:hypothetical protein